MISQLLLLLILAPIVAISAFCFSCILTRPDFLLGSFDYWASRNLPEWLYKPLIGCQYCVAGQWFFWLYYLIAYVRGIVYPYFELHLLFTLVTIFLTVPVTKIFNKHFA